MVSLRHRLRHFAWGAFIPAMALTLLGIFLVRFADFGSLPSGGMAPGDKQIFSLAISLAAFALVLVPSYLHFRRLAFPAYAMLAALTLFAALYGMERNGARRWIHLGFYDLTPSEFLKLGLVLVLARLLMYRPKLRKLPSLILPFALAGLPVAIVAKQPDLGTALLFIPIPFVLLYASGARRQHLLLCGVALVSVAGIVAVGGTALGLLRPYQEERIQSFVALLGLGRANASPETFQAEAGLVAIGTGGVTGLGGGQRAQAVVASLPEKHTDFIFAVAGARFGFLGTALIVALYAWLTFSLLRVAARTREPFGRLVVVGVATLTVTQTFVNLGVTTGCLPVTGLPLPFLSYGGSSLLSTMLYLGIALNVSMRRVRVIARDTFDGT